jgi:hypothetical protein
VTAAILVLALALAAANGANDVPKTVATLAGAGVTRYRTAIAWGTVTTFVGALVSLTFAAELTKLFSKGIFTATPTPEFSAGGVAGNCHVGDIRDRRAPPPCRPLRHWSVRWSAPARSSEPTP